MKLHLLIPAFLAILLLPGTEGCFPVREITMQQMTAARPVIDSLGIVKTPTKVFLSDASVAILPKGFTFHHDTLSAQGVRYFISGSQSELRDFRFPVDSITAISYYDQTYSAGRVIGSFFLGFFGVAETGLAAYCLACPKCCFGSCPTVYTSDATGQHFEAELFSYSISRLLEEGDLDRISTSMPNGGDVELSMKNEALETHYINSFTLVAARHPHGSMVFPSDNGKILCVKSLSSPVSAIDRQGRNVLELVLKKDGKSYRSDSALFARVEQGDIRDYIDLTLPNGANDGKATMVIRFRNTLLSTALLYDVVLASQGIQAVEWTRRMNEDRIYAAQFRAVYSAFSGIEVSVGQGSTWRKAALLRDPGPIGWKEAACELRFSPGENSVRLSFFPDNVMIDYLGFDRTERDAAEVITRELTPVAIKDNMGSLHPEILPLIQSDDSRYLVTEPGESYRFSYTIPRGEGSDVTLFIRSRGYYSEWIRKNWMIAGHRAHPFDINDIDGTIHGLVQSWGENRRLLEDQFFPSRIAVREVQ